MIVLPFPSFFFPDIWYSQNCLYVLDMDSLRWRSINSVSLAFREWLDACMHVCVRSSLLPLSHDE